MSVIVSFFTSMYVLKWKEFFPQKDLEYPPSFDGRAVCYPSSDIIRDYLAWRQVDCEYSFFLYISGGCFKFWRFYFINQLIFFFFLNNVFKFEFDFWNIVMNFLVTHVIHKNNWFAGHINNQYNTCFWMLVKSGKSKSEAQGCLKVVVSFHAMIAGIVVHYISHYWMYQIYLCRVLIRVDFALASKFDFYIHLTWYVCFFTGVSLCLSFFFLFLLPVLWGWE